MTGVWVNCRAGLKPITAWVCREPAGIADPVAGRCLHGHISLWGGNAQPPGMKVSPNTHPLPTSPPIGKRHKSQEEGAPQRLPGQARCWGCLVLSEQKEDSNRFLCSSCPFHCLSQRGE